MAYAEALDLAERLLLELADCYVEAIIAGSIRRDEPTVGDIEVVAVPSVELRYERDLFGDIVSTVPVDHLAARLTTLADNGVVRPRPRADGKLVWGPFWKSFTYEGAPIDLFTPEQARLGWILALRTGPAAFSRQLVVERGRTTKDGRRGLLPPTLKPRDGWLTWRTSGERIETPTERHVFDLFGLSYPAPRARR
jgi:DNA polymerase/3'-5' exonuclease PolX